ncbi:MAG: DUF721 domain-containing protein [Betaproteobacteria bacterium]|nr:DUF721 domain-containing protein [Betaproteobacteria bacterium]
MRENPALKPVHDRLAALSRLQKTIADTLPVGLKDSCRVATVEGSTLVIATANGATAARLKQMLPRLLEALRSARPEPGRGENRMKEQQVTVITVLVQPNFSFAGESAPAHAARPPLPPAMLAELAAKLTDSPLKRTITRLAAKSKRGLTD